MSKQHGRKECVISGCKSLVPSNRRICDRCRKRHSLDHTPYKFKPGFPEGKLVKPYDMTKPPTRRRRLSTVLKIIRVLGGSESGTDLLTRDLEKQIETKHDLPSELDNIERMAGHNIISYCRHTPYRSKERKEIEQILVEDAPAAAMALALQRSENYVRCLKKKNYREVKILSHIGLKIRLFNYRLPEEIIENVKDWIKKNTEVTSGSRTERYIQRPTSHDFYLDYCEQAKLHNEYVVSKSTLKKIKEDIGVVKRPFDRFDCTKCIQLELYKHSHDGAQITPDLLFHKTLLDCQRSFYKYTRDYLEAHQILLAIDFASLPTFGTNATKEINDLVVCYYTRSADRTTVIKRNIDIIGQHEHNWIFLREAFRALKNIGLFNPFEQIIFWSDGGPHHFKVRKSLKIMPEVINRNQHKIFWFFFAADHGHSECDAHTGAVKTRINSDIKKGNRPCSLEEFKAIIEQIPNTRVIILDHFDNEDTYASFVGVKTYFAYDYDCPSHHINCSVMAGSENLKIINEVPTKFQSKSSRVYIISNVNL